MRKLLSGWSCGTNRSSPQNQCARFHGKRDANARRRKTFIKPTRRRTAGQADRESAVARLRQTAEPFGDIVREHFGIGEGPALALLQRRSSCDNHCGDRAVSNSCYGGRVIVGTEYCRSGDDRVCTGGYGQRGIFAVLSAIDLDPRVQSS